MPRRVIAFDAGGTKVLCGVVDEDLHVSHRAALAWPEPKTQENVLGVFAHAFADAREAAPDAVAVGVGLPSNVDVETGTSVSSRHLPLDGFPFGDWLSRESGLPVALDNDSTLAMLAEQREGAARGAANAAMLTIGTGVGGGVVAGGVVLRGSRGSAGEPGHMTIEADGPPCPGDCPNRGCLEAFVSGPALASAAGMPTGADVVQAARAGDPGAREALERMGEKLGAGITSILNLLDPEVVVVGGGLGSDAAELLLAPAERVARERALEPAASRARIVNAGLGADAGLIGAALLALEARG